MKLKTLIQMTKRIFFFLAASALVINCSSQVKEGEEIATASGLKYKILKKGDGRQPKAGDKVSVHYAGKLTDGTEFDNSYKRGQPFSFKLGQGQVIKGWDEGIGYLHVGDSALFTIPADLGYGGQQAGSIPPNSTLIFTVKLMDVSEGPKPWDAKGKDTITTKSGLKYVIFQKGTGPSPAPGDKVKVHYSGYLRDGKPFDSSVERGEPIGFQCGKGQVIAGWDEGLQLLQKGSKAKLIIPWQLAYGEAGRPPVIPAKADLIFDVELVDFTPHVTPVPYDTKGKQMVKTASGLQYYVITKGTGAQVQKGQTVTIHYTGYFSDGKIFDSSVERSEPITFQAGMGQMIKGFDEGLLLMHQGDKIRFVIPYSLAYGEAGRPPVIPAKADLTFDVELIGIK